MYSPADTKPVDGGYGWVVCISGFFCWFIGDGIAFSFGVLFVSLLEEFDAGPTNTAWIGAAFVGGHNLMGPVAGALSRRIGSRVTAILGSIIATVGFIGAMFAPNIAVLALTYGVIGGSGLNFILVVSVEMVSVYFKKRRALANGIVTCGSGVGGFIVPILLRVLIDEFGWRGAVLILGGISFNGCVLGALFRPTCPQKEVIVPLGVDNGEDIPKIDISHSLEQNANLCSKDCQSAHRCAAGTVPGTERQMQGLSPCTQIQGPDMCRLSSQRQSREFKNDLVQSENSEKAPDHDVEGTFNQDLVQRDGTESPFLTQSGLGLPGSEAVPQNLTNKLHFQENVSSALFIGSMASLSGVENRARMRNYRRESLVAMTSFCRQCSEAFGISLLEDKPMFLLIILSCTFWTGQLTLFVYLVDYALSRQIDKTHGTVLLSIIGIVNTFGRIGVGLLTDHPKVDSFVVYGIALVVAGAVNAVLPFCSSFAMLAACVTVFGISVAAFVSLRAIIIVDFLGVEKMTRGFGLVLFSQGFGFLVGPPIAGAIYEASGTYKAPFLTAASFFILAALLIIPVRWQLRKKSHDEVIT